MLIGELAQKTNLSRHTIRFYEKVGLIQIPNKARRDNNYKEYTEETLRQLQAIQLMKAQGFTLKEARAIIELVKNGTLDATRARNYVLKKVQLIDKQIAALQHTKQTLLEVADKCGSTDCDVYAILNR